MDIEGNTLHLAAELKISCGSSVIKSRNCLTDYTTIDT